MGARALARLATAQRHWHHCATTLAQTHALAAFDPHYWRLLLAGASARVYHSANIWPRLAPSFRGKLFQWQERKRFNVSALARSRNVRSWSVPILRIRRFVSKPGPARGSQPPHGSQPFRAESNSARCVRDDEGDAEEGFGIEWADDEHRPVVVLAGPVEFVADIGTDCAPQISRA